MSYSLYRIEGNLMPDEIFHLDTLKMFTLNSYNLTWWVYTNNQLRSIDGLAPVNECEINSLPP
jgi:hypothetical protein